MSWAKGGDDMPPATSLTDAPSCLAVMRRALEPQRQCSSVYTIDVRSISDQPFGRETFSQREDAEMFIEEVRRENPQLANELRIEERELVARWGRRSRIRPLREVA
jgi:hypothetical protein